MNADTKVVTNAALMARRSRILTNEDFKSGYVNELVTLLKEKAHAIEWSREEHKHILGMSAVQLDKPEAVCIVRNRFGRWLVLVNPIITYRSEDSTTKNYEKCLSFPNKPFEVIRYNRIKIRYLTEHGTLCERTFAGRIGRRVQHEIDHINGVVPIKKQFERGKMFESSRKI